MSDPRRWWRDRPSGLGGRDRKADLLHGGSGRDFCFTSPDWARCDGLDRKVSIENR